MQLHVSLKETDRGRFNTEEKENEDEAIKDRDWSMWPQAQEGQLPMETDKARSKYFLGASE